jgi:hypothetical protein
MSKRLSEEFHQLAEFCRHKDLTLKELVAHVGMRAHALITLVLSLPFLLFLPLPGLSVIFGVFILINGVQIATGKKLWFPGMFLKRKMSGATLAKHFLTASRLVKKLEKVVKPRGKFLARHPHLQILHGILLAICGFFLALPLPPGTNFPPALASALISIGVLEEDGVFIVLGYISFLLTIAFFTLLPYYGFEELSRMFRKQ